MVGPKLLVRIRPPAWLPSCNKELATDICRLAQLTECVIVDKTWPKIPACPWPASVLVGRSSGSRTKIRQNPETPARMEH